MKEVRCGRFPFGPFALWRRCYLHGATFRSPSDPRCAQTYLNFMLIYMGDYTEENLQRCGIEEVTSEVLGFVE